MGGEAEKGERTWETLVYRTLINQFQWFCFQHEAKKFLFWFCFKDDGFSVEPVIKQHFVWWEMHEAGVPKDQTVVHVANVANEEVVIG